MFDGNPEVKLAERINNLSRGCEIKVDSSTKSISLQYLPVITDIIDSKKYEIKYESNFYGEVYGPIHTGSGNIIIDKE